MLLARAAVARDVLPEGLRGRGAGPSTWSRPTAPSPSRSTRRAAAALAGAEVVTFTSSSTVTNFLDAGRAPTRCRRSSPPSARSRPPPRATHGLTVDVEAEVHTIDGLVDALVAWAAEHPASP